MPDINWNAAYGFWLVAKHGSFAEAARALPRGSIQALHKRVRGLETKNNLDLHLLKSRGVKGVQLTEAGQRLYECLNQVFRDFDNLASDLRAEASGTLHVAATAFVAENYVSGIIAAFSPRFPDVSIHLRVCAPPEVMFQVENGRADIGICAPFGPLPAVTAARACPMRLELLVPSGSSKAPFASWEQIVKFPLILPEKTSVVRQAFDELMRKRGLESRVRVKAELTTPDLSLEAVRAGLGVAVVAAGPRFPAHPAGILRLNLPPGLPRLHLSVVTGKNHYTPSYMAAFLTAAVSTMSKRAKRRQ